MKWITREKIKVDRLANDFSPPVRRIAPRMHFFQNAVAVPNA
jgi:hypothetical protein